MMGWGSECCSTEEKLCPISRALQQQQERREQDRWDIVDGTEVKPDETQSEFKNLRKSNAKALHAIRISCGPNATSSILGIDSAKAVWDHLVSMQLEVMNVDYAWAILLNREMKEGDLVTTKMILDGRPSAVRTGITFYAETTLFKTALSRNLPFVKELVHIRDNQELLPLIFFATNGNKDMVHYLYDKTSKDFVIVSIVTDVYDLVLDILNKYEKLAAISGKFGVRTMYMLAGKTSVFISVTFLSTPKSLEPLFKCNENYNGISCAAVIVNIREERVVTLPGIAITWGLAVMVMMYSIDHICGAHFNPAITIVFTTSCRFPLKQVKDITQYPIYKKVSNIERFNSPNRLEEKASFLLE
ncbi:hypothetical protein GIB67_036713, partial [Kingdonia uniflora]